MIGERNLAPERGPSVWTRTERVLEPHRSRWVEGLGGAALAAVGAALVAAGSGRVYRALRKASATPASDLPQGLSEHADDQVAFDSDASFPASDAPSWTPVEGVTPRRLGATRAATRSAGVVPSVASAGTRAALGGPGGIHIVEQVRIARPLAEVYRFWRDLTNLPRFMRHVQSVTTDGRRSHWVVRKRSEPLHWMVSRPGWGETRDSTWHSVPAGARVSGAAPAWRTSVPLVSATTPNGAPSVWHLRTMSR